MDFKKSFCWHFDPNNNDIIYFLVDRSENGEENDTFWFEISSGFGELGSTLPPRIHRGIPPPPAGQERIGVIAIEANIFKAQ